MSARRRATDQGVLTVVTPVSAGRESALRRFLAYPMYRAYQTRTDRDLRVFALTRR